MIGILNKEQGFPVDIHPVISLLIEGLRAESCRDFVSEFLLDWIITSNIGFRVSSSYSQLLYDPADGRK